MILVAYAYSFRNSPVDAIAVPLSCVEPARADASVVLQISLHIVQHRKIDRQAGKQQENHHTSCHNEEHRTSFVFPSGNPVGKHRNCDDRFLRLGASQSLTLLQLP